MIQRAFLIATSAAALLVSGGVVVASAVQDTPQEAQAADPIGEILRREGQAPQPGASESPSATPTPASAQSGTPPPAAPVVVVEAPEEEVVEEEAETEEVGAAAPTPAPEGPPGQRQRRPVVIVQAIDKITAETMRFEVEVGGRPVRFNQSLVVRARACEVSASDEQAEDAIAYLEIGVQRRGADPATEARQVFRGWMFALSPAVSGLQHPIYDAWVVGCKS